MLIKSHEQLNQAVCETFFSSQLSKMGMLHIIEIIFGIFSSGFIDYAKKSPVM